MKTWVANLLCAIGLHKWKYIPSGYDLERYRECQRCGLHQIYDDFALMYEDAD